MYDPAFPQKGKGTALVLSHCNIQAMGVHIVASEFVWKFGERKDVYPDSVRMRRFVLASARSD